MRNAILFFLAIIALPGYGQNDEIFMYKCAITKPDYITKKIKEATDSSIYGERIGFTYGEFTFLINKPENYSVDLRDDAYSTRKGPLEITEFHYNLAFPHVESTNPSVGGILESAVIINRVTNEFKIEWGRPPFFESKEENVYQEGICEIGDYNVS